MGYEEGGIVAGGSRGNGRERDNALISLLSAGPNGSFVTFN